MFCWLVVYKHTLGLERLVAKFTNVLQISKYVWGRVTTPYIYIPYLFVYAAVVVSNVSSVRGGGFEIFVAFHASKIYKLNSFRILIENHLFIQNIFICHKIYQYVLWYNTLWLTSVFLFLKVLKQISQVSLTVGWCWSLMCLLFDELVVNCLSQRWHVKEDPKIENILTCAT